MDKDTFSNYLDMIITVDGVDVLLNVVGGIEHFGGRHFIVITDCPVLEISDEEYDIFEVIRTESGDETIISVTSEEQYDTLIEIWEDRVRETKQSHRND